MELVKLIKMRLHEMHSNVSISKSLHDHFHI
jgi:hypothetical protein